ncbi:hypothetical protein AB0L65_32815 [Nonomuraea sp. NPDC052116]|uniref:hypothetical protein n=1 Tax=Nonomuraea sp. NPDC052116 TaxID=3155665 RepID=UPI00341615E8
MTALDENAPLFANSFAEIRERDERSLKRAEDPAWPLSQAEADRSDLMAKVDRLTAERDRLDEAAKHMGDALAKVGIVMQNAARTAVEHGAGAGMDVIVGYLSDAGMLPPVLTDPQDGGDTRA